jgi:5-methylcytosine-specific restriction endonuclease McrA
VEESLLLAYDSVAVSNAEVQNEQALNSPENTRKRECLSIRKRFFVMKRDHFACVKCGASGYGVKLEVDHIVPFSKGGTDALDNLQTLCFNCNRGKRNDFE